MNEDIVIEINKEYDCFDDGKIRESRRFSVIVKEKIPFNEVDKELLLQWEEEVKECYWLYSKNTDFFIKAVNINDDKEVHIFVRTLDNGWFGLGFNAGRLKEKSF